MGGFATYLEHIGTNDDNISHCWFPDRTTNQAFSFPRVPGYFIRFIQFFSHFPSSGGSVNDYLSLSSWMGTSQIWLNNGSYLTTTSSLSQDFCPGSHPSIFVPQARPALAEETSASFLAQSGISRQEGVNFPLKLIPSQLIIVLETP